MLGMYIHTHWAYEWPYAARTWSKADWLAYLGALDALGYDAIMVWPQLDSMPPEPNASDRAALDRINTAIRTGRERFGMRFAIVACPNTIGNDCSPDYAWERRPYFICERKIDPSDESQLQAFLAGRRRQFAHLNEADSLVIIDSDPGGFPGSTNTEFARLVTGQAAAFREFNRSGDIGYWMLFGWERYCHFWQQALDAGGDAAAHPGPASGMDTNCFVETLRMLQRDLPEPWWTLAWFPEHINATDQLGLREKRLFFPYGTIEGEPTFPLTDFDPERVAATIGDREIRTRFPLGAMANAQTHCLQPAHTCLFAHLARGGSLNNADFEDWADRIAPGHGPAAARGWQALRRQTPPDEREDAAREIRASMAEHLVLEGPLTGLVLGAPRRFLEDLATNLELRAACSRFAALAGHDNAHALPALRNVLDVLTAWRERTGFEDAYGGILVEELNGPLGRLGDAKIDAALRLFTDWSDPTVRNGLAVRLLEAVRDFLERKGTRP